MDRGHSKGPSLDRQITVQDVECLREAFALFDPDKEKEMLTPERLGKVRSKEQRHCFFLRKKNKGLSEDIEWSLNAFLNDDELLRIKRQQC